MAGDHSSVVARLVRALAIVEDGLLVVMLAGLIVLAAAQIALRNLLDTSLLWADPAVRVVVLWVGMIGAMVATRFDKQISVDAVSRFLPGRWKSAVRVVTDLFTAAVSLALAWHSTRLLLGDREGGVTVFAAVPLWVCELVLPVAFGVIGLRYLAYALAHGRKAVGPGAAG
ncbi:MAG TPA: TRAP transporter small permease [Thermoanaerobaculales bacterium]|nr:TRAP transporter small permease [Thermoanaerobaculales bacterium]HPA81723.1 TRAP transporter small permease [Thermoanaerobaculales bacterium]HQL31209.1 TRAP transporter small permease [Thermoanaerobaculales bacterium]HQP44456.1 TRAP transporter small permease [Thermoanaerobaculales bacterium]